MRYAIVTETYPPEINGVALTVQGLEQGLRERGNAVSVIRPRQATDAVQSIGDDTLLMRGASLPRYPGLKFGLPAIGKLRRHWQANRPDAIYVATEGPLGWSALRAARQLGIPAATGFHTRFDTYMRDYGLPMLAPVALRWDAPLPQQRAGHPGPDPRTAVVAGIRRLRQRGEAGARGRHRPLRSLPSRSRAAGPVGASANAWRRGHLRRAHRRGEEPRTGGGCVPRPATATPGGPLRLGRRRPGARSPATREPRLHLLRPATRRSPGPPFRQRRPVRVPQPQRDLRQRHPRSARQRRADGCLRLRRRPRMPARWPAWRRDPAHRPARPRRCGLHRRGGPHRQRRGPRDGACAPPAAKPSPRCDRRRSPATSTICCRSLANPGDRHVPIAAL